MAADIIPLHITNKRLAQPQSYAEKQDLRLVAIFSNLVELGVEPSKLVSAALMVSAQYELKK